MRMNIVLDLKQIGENEYTLSLPDTTKDQGAGISGECPWCGKKLIERSGPNGKFIGCTGFKDGCKYSEDLPEAVVEEPGDEEF